MRGHSEILRYLAEAKADVDLPDEVGFNPRHSCVARVAVVFLCVCLSLFPLLDVVPAYSVSLSLLIFCMANG